MAEHAAETPEELATEQAEVERLAALPTFDYFGETFHYAAEYPHFLFAEFCEVMQEDVVTQAQAKGWSLRLAIAMVEPVDRARFRAVSRKNNAADTDWLKVAQGWTAEVAERPTGLPTDSSVGPSSTAGKSEAGPDATVTSLPAAKAARPEKRPPRGDIGWAVAQSQGLG